MDVVLIIRVAPDIYTVHVDGDGAGKGAVKEKGGDNDNCKGLAHHASSSGSQFEQQSKNDANTFFEKYK